MFNAHSRLLEKDHRLAFLVLFGVVATVSIVPFGLWRISQGQLLVGLLELSMVFAFDGLVWYAWRSQRITLIARTISVIVTLGCLALTPFIGKLALHWAYAVVIANIMLAGRKIGSCLNLLLLIGIVLLQGGQIASLEAITFLAAALSVSIYAYVFALSADQQREKLEALAAYDGLTGTGNRRMMEYELQDAFGHARQHGAKHGLAVIDIDHFKAVNDTFGHAAGDHVLVRLAQLLSRSLRSGDRLYRMGGEEFVILMPDTGPEGLALALDRLQSLLRSRLMGPADPITVSIGASTTLEDEPSWQSWLARADEALYAAKTAGRNQVKIAAESGGVRPPRTSRRRLA